MTQTSMLRYHLNLKTLLWAIAIGTILLLVITLLLFQNSMDGIEQQLDNLNAHENH